MRILLLCLGFLLGGCNAGYYWHLARGHTSLMADRVPVADVLAAPDTPELQRQQLMLAADALVFADEALDLPANGSYQTFVALDRSWVVWNLFAAPEFSLEPHQWCYPVAGCASYRGYFDRDRADSDAQALRQAGLDVHGAGAIAYSTLGWFNDPLTPPILLRSEGSLVELLFHELVHQRFYLKGDTRFNESLATAVARHGRTAWFAHSGSQDDAGASALASQQARDILDRARADLEALYASGLPEPEMRLRKQQIQRATRERYYEALQSQPALQPWQGFFEGPLNNAQLNTVADYNQWVPAFTSLIDQCDAQWPCFWKAVERLAKLDSEARNAALAALQERYHGDD